MICPRCTRYVTRHDEEVARRAMGLFLLNDQLQALQEFLADTPEDHCMQCIVEAMANVADDWTPSRPLPAGEYVHRPEGWKSVNLPW